MKFAQSSTVIKYTYCKIMIDKKIISTQGTNILNGFKKKKKICCTNPKKCPFFLHNFVKHVSGDYWFTINKVTILKVIFR